MARIEAQSPEFDERLIQLKPVAKTVKGGRKRRFSALMVVGDGKGNVGAAIGKAVGVPDAIRKGVQKAKTRMVSVRRNGTTIPYQVIGRVGAARVLLKPASPGTGVIAGGPVRAVVEAAGIRDLLTKNLGSDNAITCVWAALEGLGRLRDPKEVARIRGVSVESFPRYLRRLDVKIEGDEQDDLVIKGQSAVEDNTEKEPDRVLEGSKGDNQGTGTEKASSNSNKAK